MTFKKILCPVDFSEGSSVALRVAAQLSRESNGQLVVIHVWDAPVMYGPEAAFTADTITTLQRDAEAGLARWKADAEELRGTPVEAVLRSGSAWDHIVGAAEQDPSIELVVIGTHGRTGLTRVLLGSVAEKVVRHAPCPVLVARDRR